MIRLRSCFKERGKKNKKNKKEKEAVEESTNPAQNIF